MQISHVHCLEQVWYDDARSIGAKTALACALKLRGVGAWIGDALPSWEPSVVSALFAALAHPQHCRGAREPPRFTDAAPSAPGIELWRQRSFVSAPFPTTGPSTPSLPSGDCRGVHEFHSGTPAVTGRFWRWNITATHDGSAPTIHWLQLGLSGNQGGKSHWISNTTGWTVSANAMSNGPASNLIKYGDHVTTFWNGDQPPGCLAPWVATIDTKSVVAADSMRYSVFDAHESPQAFVLEASPAASGPWRTVVTAAGVPAGPCQGTAGPPQTSASDSFGFADFFLALTIAVPNPTGVGSTLLVFTEARKFSDEDWGAKGIAMRASATNGRSWSPSRQVVTDPPQVQNLTAELSRHTSFGPFDGEGYDGISLGAVTLDRHTGKVFVHYTICGHPCHIYGCQRPKICGPAGSGRMFYVASQAPFSEWAEPVDISAMLPFDSFAFGPGEGTQAASGRLIICGYFTKSGNFGSAMVVSDDNGLTWSGGAELPKVSAAATNECDAAVLRNNSILVTFRAGGGHRVQARSDDEGRSFVANSVRAIEALPDSGCQGSMVSASDGVLYFSGPYSSVSRSNMTVSRSTDDGDSWHDLVQVYPSYSGYNSLTVIEEESTRGYSLGLAYNRGWDGDGCTGDACPYSTVLSYATIPIVEQPSGFAHESQTSAEEGEEQQEKEEEQEMEMEQEGSGLMSFGWWDRHFPPDSAGLLDNYDTVLVSIALPNCTSTGCTDHLNFTELIFGPSPLQLANGSALESLHSLILWGRETYRREKFAFVQQQDQRPGGLWQTVIDSGACFMQQQQLQGAPHEAADADCARSMTDFAKSLCAMLQRAGLDSWLFDVDLQSRSNGPGTAQALRFLLDTCARSFGVQLKIGWVIRGSTGEHSYIHQNWTLISSNGSRPESMVTFLELFLSVADNTTVGHYFSAENETPFPGECSEGYDATLMEFGHWARDFIPFQKLVIGTAICKIIDLLSNSTHTEFAVAYLHMPATAPLSESLSPATHLTAS
eukprot:COSAG03_NODE_829_length_5707_cov_19.504101_3_plen_999_part_00